VDLGIEGKVALVTASSRGLGKASAMALAAEGVRVVITARGEESLAKAEEELQLAGADVFAVSVDVTRPDSPAQLVAAAIQRYERLDIVVANAGGPPPGSALDIDDDALRLAFEANTLTSIRLVRAALPHMRAAGWGRLCCITSYSVVQPIPGLALSNTARTGLWAWAKTAAADIAAADPAITLNIVCPGAHATDRMLELGGGAGGARLGDPDEFGQVVAFLCSQPAAYVNGAAVVVDGGATLAL
jgi:3-oxoacyl-[acyl-carrier protein] reductase